MISEKGRVVAVEDDALWVETIQKTTCGSCVAQKGCGQSLLSKLGIKNSFLRVLLQQKSASDYSIGDEVDIGIPDDIVVKSSLFAYLLPIVLLVLFSGFAQQFFEQELYVIGMGLLGLLAGAGLIKIFSYTHRNDSRYQPVLLDDLLSGSRELNIEPDVVRLNDESC